MKMVKAKNDCNLFIKDEWYKVISILNIGNSISTNAKLYAWYELENHTDKKWDTNWHREFEFYNLNEIRDIKLNSIL